MKQIFLVMLMAILISGCGGEAKEVPNAAENNDEVQTIMAQNKIIQIQIGSQTFEAVLENNPTAEAFLNKLPLEIELDELNGNEKYHHFSERFPTDDTKPYIIRTGDLMIYSGSYFVLFYKDFETIYSYTRLGRIENPEGLAEAVGSGNVKVSIKN